MKNKKILIIVFAIVILVIGFIVFDMFKGENVTSEILNSENGFFIYDDGKYALFSVEGKKITDFIFSDAEDFYDHVAAVKNDKGEYAIIKDNGKYLVEFGKYKSIKQRGTMFKLYHNGGFDVLSSKGEIMMKNVSVFSSLSGSGDYLYIIIGNNNNIKIIDNTGKVLDALEQKEFGGVEGVKLTDNNNYATISYNEMYFVYDLITGKKIYTFNDPINIEESDDGKILAIDIGEEHKIFVDGKQKFTINKNCSSLNFINDGVLCYLSPLYTMYNMNGRIISENVVAYFDTKNYIEKKADRKYQIYTNGKLGVIQNESNIRYVSPGMPNVAYKVDYNSFGTGFIGVDGSVLCNDDIYYVDDFNDYGSTYVIDRDGNKYLVNKKCNKISDIYTSIKFKGNSFFEGEKDNIKYMLSSNGEILESGYTEFDYNYRLQQYIVRYENKVVLYVSGNDKKVYEFNVADLSFDRNYAYKYINGKTTYYSYKTGKEFYTQK